MQNWTKTKKGWNLALRRLAGSSFGLTIDGGMDGVFSTMEHWIIGD